MRVWPQPTQHHWPATARSIPPCAGDGDPPGLKALMGQGVEKYGYGRMAIMLRMSGKNKEMDIIL